MPTITAPGRVAAKLGVVFMLAFAAHPVVLYIDRDRLRLDWPFFLLRLGGHLLLVVLLFVRPAAVRHPVIDRGGYKFLTLCCLRTGWTWQ